MSALLDSLQTHLDAVTDTSPALGHRSARQSALQSAVQTGLPLPRSESWKYTSLRALSARSLAASRQRCAVDPALLSAIPAPRLVFVNGLFDASRSCVKELPAGVTLSAWSNATSDSALAIDLLATAATDATDAVFTLLNQALAHDGALIDIADGVTLNSAVHLVFVGAATAQDVATHLRHHIALGEHAAATVIEHHLGSDVHRQLHNHLTTCTLASGASLQHARIQREDAGASIIARSQITIGPSARYQRSDLELGAGLSRHELAINLHGAGAELVSGGVLFADGRRHLDTRINIQHSGLNTRCEVLWRGLADARARAVFHGGIHIQPGADGSDAALSSKSLLLSDQAEIDTQPVLEIYADEVKASHGATIGQLDAAALFYLRSRGLPLAQARSLLIAGFLREPLQALDNPELAAVLAAALSAQLNDELA